MKINLRAKLEPDWCPYSVSVVGYVDTWDNHDSTHTTRGDACC